MKVKLKTITPNAEINLVEIARVSSSRADKTESPEKLINYLIKNKHWSPFQHSYLTFEIETSKAIGIQLLRHLSFTFQEFSQRYSKISELESIDFRIQAEKNRQSSTDSIGWISVSTEKGVFIERKTPDEEINKWLDYVGKHLSESLFLYEKGIELGIAKECVRMILPMTTKTTIYMTGSIRSWIHFLAVRDDGHAQLEAQQLAKEIKRIFKENLPLISEALEY